MSPGERMAGSVPGLLDSLSCGSTADISCAEREPSIPQIAQACFRHLENFGLRTLGIFRVSSSKKRVRQVGTDFTDVWVLKSKFSPWTVYVRFAVNRMKLVLTFSSYVVLPADHLSTIAPFLSDVICGGRYSRPFWGLSIKILWTRLSLTFIGQTGRPCNVKWNSLRTKGKRLSYSGIQGWAFKMKVTLAVNSYIGIKIKDNEQIFR
jgi:hypothetical protein